MSLLIFSLTSDLRCLPVSLITGLYPFNLSAYGLRARWPTLRDVHYCSPPKVSLLGGWLDLPRWASLPLDQSGIARPLQYLKPAPKVGV